jgi:hypothetical protein
MQDSVLGGSRLETRGQQPKKSSKFVLIEKLRAQVNPFVDHSEIVQLECLRSGIWGTRSLWEGTCCVARPWPSRSPFISFVS